MSRATATPTAPAHQRLATGRRSRRSRGRPLRRRRPGRPRRRRVDRRPRRRAALPGLRTALEGTPGRMRLLGFVAALAAAVFGIIGATSLWSAAGALGPGRPQHRSRSCASRASTPTSCGPTPTPPTPSSSAGSRTPPSAADYDAALARVATGIADAARAQPADSAALGSLNTKVQTYASTVEQARVYNRQGQPVGAQYLNQASASLRSDVLPVVDALQNGQQPAGQRRVRAPAAAGRPCSSPAWPPSSCSSASWSGWPVAPTATSTCPSASARCSSCWPWRLGAITLGGVGSQVSLGPQLRLRLHRRRRVGAHRGVRRQVQREPHPHLPRLRRRLRDGLEEAVRRRLQRRSPPCPPTGRGEAHKAT